MFHLKQDFVAGKYQEKLAKEINCLEPIVLDLGVGKGGDLLKWDKGHIKKLV